MVEVDQRKVPDTIYCTISEEGEKTILYKSTDRAGNIEIQKEQLVKIDKTAPEAKIFLNPDTLSLTVEGTDNLTEIPTISSTTTPRKNDDHKKKHKKHKEKNKDKHDNEKKDKKEHKHDSHLFTAYSIEDEAGNITELIFNELKQKTEKIKAKLESIQYGSNPVITFPRNEIKYKWELDKDSDTIKELKQKLKVKRQFEIKAEFENGITKIKIKEEHKKKQRLELEGLIIVGLTTNKGSLEYKY